MKTPKLSPWLENLQRKILKARELTRPLKANANKLGHPLCSGEPTLGVHTFMTCRGWGITHAVGKNYKFMMAWKSKRHFLNNKNQRKGAPGMDEF